jgi:phosphoglycolate phosphatase
MTRRHYLPGEPASTTRPTILLYDWDNTLVDAWAGITAAMNAALAAFAMPPWTIEETRQRARISMRDSFPVLFGEDWRRARNVFHTTMLEQHLAHVRPMPGATEALEAGRPWPQGVVSNKSGRYLRAEIAHLGWAPLFGPMVGAGDAKADKPDPAPLLMALEQLSAPADPSVWYLGDTATDMQAARAAGITGVLVGDAAHDGGVEHASPDLYFPDAYQLAAQLRTLA